MATVAVAAFTFVESARSHIAIDHCNDWYTHQESVQPHLGLLGPPISFSSAFPGLHARATTDHEPVPSTPTLTNC